MGHFEEYGLEKTKNECLDYIKALQYRMWDEVKERELKKDTAKSKILPNICT